MSPPCRFLKVCEEATRNPAILLRGQKREVFALSATYPLIEVLLKKNRSIWHPLLEKNRPKAKAKDTVSSFPKTGKQHLTLWPATHLPRSNHRLLWAAIMHTPHWLQSKCRSSMFLVHENDNSMILLISVMITIHIRIGHRFISTLLWVSLLVPVVRRNRSQFIKLIKFDHNSKSPAQTKSFGREKNARRLGCYIRTNAAEPQFPDRCPQFYCQPNLLLLSMAKEDYSQLFKILDVFFFYVERLRTLVLSLNCGSFFFYKKCFPHACGNFIEQLSHN